MTTARFLALTLGKLQRASLDTSMVLFKCAETLAPHGHSRGRLKRIEAATALAFAYKRINRLPRFSPRYSSSMALIAESRPSVMCSR